MSDICLLIPNVRHDDFVPVRGIILPDKSSEQHYCHAAIRLTDT